jgi:thiopeptide-type bacteriocin biosynthesis protein
VVRNITAVQIPGSPACEWLYAQPFTPADRMDDILATLPQLLAELDEPDLWFARYPSVRETDHLRLRIQVDGPHGYEATATAVGRWAHELSARGAASGLTLATYRPEIGRYGDRPARAAAEVVFADSAAVLSALRPAGRRLDPQVLTAISDGGRGEGSWAGADRPERFVEIVHQKRARDRAE